MKKLLTAAAVAGAMAFAPAHAGIVSFADYAATEGEHGVASGTDVVIGGIGMTLISNFNPYFDGVSGGKPAGLGVCKTLTSPGAQCNPGSDDSIDGDIDGDPEYIIIDFKARTNLNGISFRNAVHDPINDSGAMVEFFVETVGGTFADGFDTFANIVAMFAGGIEDVTTIGFRYAPDGGDEFYIELLDADVVPIPAALPLLLSGIAGLGFASRRKKTA